MFRGEAVRAVALLGRDDPLADEDLPEQQSATP
jgi:hypothetical protein